MFLRLVLITLFVILAITLLAPCHAQEKKRDAIVPDAAVQELMRKFVHTPDDKKESPELVKIRELAREKPQLLAPQLVYFGAKTKDEVEGLGIFYLMVVLGSYYELRSPLIPFLEDRDEDIKKMAVYWLSIIDGRGNLAANLLHYRKPVLDKKDSLPPGLVRYIFDNYRSEALLFFASTYESSKIGDPAPKSLRWADHLLRTVEWRMKNKFVQNGDIDSAKKEVEMLAKHPGWYARRYVCYVLEEYPELATSATLGRLRNDPHPLVVERGKLIK